MNNDNLKTLSSSEAREYGKLGGIKSGQVRRDRKSFRDQFLTLLKTGDIQDKLCTVIFQKALNGDLKAFELIRDTIGEKPSDKSEDRLNVPVALVSFVAAKEDDKEKEIDQINDAE